MPRSLPLYTELTDPAGLPHGMSYSSMGKAALTGEIGSRYFVIKDNYDIYADYLYTTLGQTETQDANRVFWH